MADLIIRPPEPEIIRPGDEDGQVRIHAANHPYYLDQAVDVVVPAGLNLREILEASQPDPYLRRYASISVEDRHVDPSDWERIRPPPGSRVYIRVLPADSDTKGVLTIIAGVALIITGVFTENPALIAAGIGLIGAGIVSLAFQNQLTDLSDDDVSSPQLQLTGSRNQVREFAPYGRVLGRVRMTPPFHPNAKPFTIIRGDDQWLVELFVWGYGPLTVPVEQTIGGTPIEEFDDVEVEHIQGWPPSPRTFAPGDVNTTTDVISIADHPYVDENILRFTTTDTLPPELAPDTNYFVVEADELNSFKLSETLGGDPIDFTGGGVGTHTATRFEEPITLYTNTVDEETLNIELTQANSWQTRTTEPDTDEITIDISFPKGLIEFEDDGDRKSRTVQIESQFAPSPGVIRTFDPADVNTTLNTINITGHPYVNDQTIDFTTSGTLPDPIALNTDYYIVNATANDFQISTSKGGAPLGLNDQGTGTHTIIQHDWSADVVGVDFPLRTSQTFKRPRPAYKNTRNGSAKIARRKIYRITINETTGALVVRGGKEFKHRVVSSFGLDKDDIRLDPPDVPRKGLAEIDLCQVIMDSERTSIDTGQDMIDTRPPPGPPPFSSGADFFCHETTPQSNRIEIDPGTLVFIGLTITAKTNSLIRRSITFEPQQPGLYDVRVRRTTADTSDIQIFDDSFWTALRSVKFEDPIPTAGIAKTAIRIRATDQLSGVVDQYSAIVESILPDWDGVNFQWIWQSTNNPASLRREVLQGTANALPAPDSRIDLPNLEELHEYCDTEEWEFNLVVDYPTTVRDVLNLISQAGQFGEARPSGKIGTVIEETPAAHTGLYSERNSFNFRGEKSLRKIPDGIRARFQNEEDNFRQGTRFVYRDGFDESNASLIQATQLTGVTRPDNVWRIVRRTLAELELRPESFQWSTDFEGLVNTRGDWVKKQNDTLKAGGATGRFKSVTLDGSNNAVSATLDDVIIMEVSKSYSLGIRTIVDVTYMASIDTVVGEQNSVTFNPIIPAAQAPKAGDLWVFGETVAGDPIDVQILAVTARPDLTFQFTGTALAPEIFDLDIRDQTFDSGNVDIGTDTFTITDHKLVLDALVRVTSDGTIPGGLVSATTSFAAGDVDPNADTINVLGTTLVNGQVVLFQTDSQLPKGLVLGQKYHVVEKSGDLIKVSLTSGGTALNLSDGGTGPHRILAYHYVVNPTTDTFQLSKTLGGAVVDLTSGGTGTHTIAVAVPPFDPNIGTAPVIPLPTPVIATDPETGQPSIRSDATVMIRNADGNLIPRILVKLDVPPGLTPLIDGTEFQFKVNGSDEPYTSGRRLIEQTSEVSITPVESGITYDFRIRYRGVDPSRSSGWSAAETHLVIGKSAPPADVQNFTGTLKEDGLYFSWDEVPDLDVDKYVIKSGVDYDSGVLVGRFDGTEAKIPRPSVTTTYWIKARDTYQPRNFSVNAASYVQTIDGPGLTTLNFAFERAKVRLEWTQTPGTYPIRQYEIRRNIFGETNFDDANNLAFVTGTSYTQGVDYGGFSLRWWVRAEDVEGNFGAPVAVDIAVSVPTISNLRSQVIDNKVTLRWEATPGTLPIENYEIRKGPTYATAEITAFADTTTYFFEETTGGTFTYWVTPIDAAGSMGPSLSIVVQVDDAPDFQLRDTFGTDFFPDSETNVSRFNQDRWVRDYKGIDFGNVKQATNYIKLDGNIMDGLSDWTFQCRALIAGPKVPTPHQASLLNGHSGTLENRIYMTVVQLGTGEYRQVDVIINNAATIAWSSGDGLPNLYDHKFHEYTFVRDGTTGAVELIIDDVSYGSKTSATGAMVIDADGLFIGQEQDGVTPGPGSFSADQSWVGKIDEIRIWDDKRTLVEVQNTSQNKLVGNEAGLVFYATADGDNPDVLDDLSDTDLNGILINVARPFSQARLHAPTGQTKTAAQWCDNNNSNNFAPGDVATNPTNTITITAHPFSGGLDGNSTRVRFSTTGTLPAPLVAGTNYWLVSINANDFQVASTKGGAAISLTTQGTGTHTIEQVFVIASDREDGGYPYAGQDPDVLTAQFEETYDLGVAVATTRIIVTLEQTLLATGIDIDPKIYVRTLNTDPWGSQINDAGVFEATANNFRYIRVVLDITATGHSASNPEQGFLDLAFVETVARVKLVNDGGDVVVPGGGSVAVNFNESFADVFTITATPQFVSGQALRAEVDFNDVPNPSSFTIYLFRDDVAFNTPIGGTVRWAARGARRGS